MAHADGACVDSPFESSAKMSADAVVAAGVLALPVGGDCAAATSVTLSAAVANQSLNNDGG